MAVPTNIMKSQNRAIRTVMVMMMPHVQKTIQGTASLMRVLPSSGRETAIVNRNVEAGSYLPLVPLLFLWCEHVCL